MSDWETINPFDRDFIQSWEGMEEFFGWMLARVPWKDRVLSLLPNFVRLDTIKNSGLDNQSIYSLCPARAVTGCVQTSPVLPSPFIRTEWSAGRKRTKGSQYGLFPVGSGSSSARQAGQPRHRLANTALGTSRSKI